MPTVSIIIPTYNRATLVCEAIDSVFQQSYEDYEIIVIDDGSTDETQEALKKYGSKIRYLYQKNAGVNPARNYGLNFARGKYVALLDSDDLWLPFKLELNVKVLEQHPDIGFCFSDFYILKEDGTRSANGLQSWYDEPQVWGQVFDSHIVLDDIIPSHDKLLKHVNGTKAFIGDIYHQSLHRPYVLPSTAMYLRNAATELEFYEQDNTGDWQFFAALSKAHGCIYIDTETIENRSHEDAVRLTRTPFQLKIRRHLDLVDRMWCQDNSFYPSHRQEVNTRRIELLLMLARQEIKNNRIREARRRIAEIKMLRDGLPSIQEIILLLLTTPIIGPLLVNLILRTR